MSRRRSLVASLGFAVACLVSAWPVGANAAANWTQELYVWQRDTGPDVFAALDEFRPLSDGFHVLAAEVNWRGTPSPTIIRPTRDYARLAALRGRVGLVLRLGPYAGTFARDDAATKTLTGLAGSLLAEARSAGMTPSELQIDFDCAEAKLGGYQIWLEALRDVTKDLPLIFTALPVWLRHEKEFAALARAADGFVLQVHSLERPASPNAPFKLCDPERAMKWAAAASQAEAPFRIALPTYGYLLGFDRSGTFLGLAAEGARPGWPADTQVRLARADAAEMAALARGLAERPPAHCSGILWFRMPVASDRLNWNALTLAAVLRGETPKAKLAFEIVWPEPGLAELLLVNSGLTTEPLSASVEITWPKPVQPIACDGLNGFRLAVRPEGGQAVLVNAGARPDALLAPGRRLKIAWLRFPHELILDASLPPPSP